MAYYFPEGSKFYFSNTFAAAKTISAITNASPALATSTAHGYVDGDEILLTSGWEDATDTVFRIDQLTADTFELEGLNTTNTNFYPAGSGPLARPARSRPGWKSRKCWASALLAATRGSRPSARWPSATTSTCRPALTRCRSRSRWATTPPTPTTSICWTSGRTLERVAFKW